NRYLHIALAINFHQPGALPRLGDHSISILQTNGGAKFHFRNASLIREYRFLILIELNNLIGPANEHVAILQNVSVTSSGFAGVPNFFAVLTNYTRKLRTSNKKRMFNVLSVRQTCRGKNKE